MAQWEKPVKTDVAWTELVFLSTEKFTEEQCRRENSRDRARQGTGAVPEREHSRDRARQGTGAVPEREHSRDRARQGTGAVPEREL